MMPSRSYYFLVASLPALPRFDEAERLPINRTRLKERLRMLHPDDALYVEQLSMALRWDHRPPGETDADVAAKYRKLLGEDSHPAVRKTVELGIDRRTILAALRRRQRGEKDSPSDPGWGVGRWVKHIELNWSDPDFKLSGVCRWVPEAREHLEKGDALALEKLMLQVAWDALDRAEIGKYFVLENVIVFLAKWDITQRWISYGEEPAHKRFKELAAALLDTHQREPQPQATLNS